MIDIKAESLGPNVSIDTANETGLTTVDQCPSLIYFLANKFYRSSAREDISNVFRHMFAMPSIRNSKRLTVHHQVAALINH